MNQIAQGNDTSGPASPVVIAEAGPLTAPDASVPELDSSEPSLISGAHHTEFASFEEGYIARYIALADTKAGFVFAGASAVIVYLFDKEEVQLLTLHPQWSPVFVLLASSFWFLSVAAVSAFGTIVPRLATSGDGVVFFGAIAKKASARDYQATVTAMTEGELAAARLVHCYDLASVCQRKYGSLRRAMWSLLPGVISATCVVLLSR
jgi:hypothetical protein